MVIEQYISQLLYRYQCVSIPGFGAFLTEIQSAQWHESSNSFYPPKKIISFNSYLKNNDGLLANQISQFEKISYENALILINKEVNSWKEALQNDNKVTLKNIGEFVLNTEGNIVFNSSDNVNYLSTSFGLSSFSAPQIRRAILQIEKSNESQEVEENVITINNDKQEKNKYSYLKYAAVFVLGLSITASSIGYRMYNEKVANDTLIVEKEVQLEVQNKIQQATFFIENPLTSNSKVATNKSPYHVVAGSFRENENAENVYQELIKKGFDAKKLKPNKNGMFPVLYGSFNSYAEAQDFAEKIKATENPDAWLLIEEL